MSENFRLEKSKELLKLNLVFRACLLAESFLPKLNRPWLCASNLIISTKTLRKTPIDEYILENAGCYWNTNPSHIFLWGLSLSHFQKFQEIVADGVTFLLKHRAIVHRTLLNPITDVFMRMFWNTYTENFGKYPEKRIKCSSNTRLKFLCRYFSGSAQKRKDILRFRHFPKDFANVWLFLLCYRFTK